jgi:hypothetical protein
MPISESPAISSCFRKEKIHVYNPSGIDAEKPVDDARECVRVRLQVVVQA